MAHTITVPYLAFGAESDENAHGIARQFQHGLNRYIAHAKEARPDRRNVTVLLEHLTIEDEAVRSFAQARAAMCAKGGAPPPRVHSDLVQFAKIALASIGQSVNLEQYDEEKSDRIYQMYSKTPLLVFIFHSSRMAYMQEILQLANGQDTGRPEMWLTFAHVQIVHCKPYTPTDHRWLYFASLDILDDDDKAYIAAVDLLRTQQRKRDVELDTLCATDLAQYVGKLRDYTWLEAFLLREPETDEERDMLNKAYNVRDKDVAALIMNELKDPAPSFSKEWNNSYAMSLTLACDTKPRTRAIEADASTLHTFGKDGIVNDDVSQECLATVVHMIHAFNWSDDEEEDSEAVSLDMVSLTDALDDIIRDCDETQKEHNVVYRVTSNDQKTKLSYTSKGWH